MYKQKLFWILVILSIISWFMWYTVLHNTSPVQSPDFAFSFFYFSFFLALTFTASLISALLWKTISPTKSSYICIKNGVRGGIIFGFIAIIACIFQQNDSLGQAEIITLILLFMLIESINIFYVK